MSTVVADRRGVDALCGELGQTLTSTPVWDQMVAELGPVPQVPVIDPFDEVPWAALPSMRELEKVWDDTPELDAMLHSLVASFSNKLPDVPQFMAVQRELAEAELRLRKERLECEQAQGADGSGSGEDGPDGVSDAVGGGASVRGYGADSAGVGVKAEGKTRAPRKRKNAGGSAKVPRVRGVSDVAAG